MQPNPAWTIKRQEIQNAELKSLKNPKLQSSIENCVISPILSSSRSMLQHLPSLRPVWTGFHQTSLPFAVFKPPCLYVLTPVSSSTARATRCGYQYDECPRCVDCILVDEVWTAKPSQAVSCLQAIPHQSGAQVSPARRKRGPTQVQGDPSYCETLTPILSSSISKQAPLEACQHNGEMDAPPGTNEPPSQGCALIEPKGLQISIAIFLLLITIILLRMASGIAWKEEVFKHSSVVNMATELRVSGVLFLIVTLIGSPNFGCTSVPDDWW